MAYPTVCEPCLDGQHSKCWDKDPSSEWNQGRRENHARPPHERLVGGAFCICTTCSESEESPWTEQVKESAIQARNQREGGK